MKLLLIALAIGCTVTSAYANQTLCTKFNPAQNKQFSDTYNLNFLTVSRANNRVSGTFTHQFDNKKIMTANVTGICTGNQMSFSWSVANYKGQFSATLTCVNNIYNLVNVIANINNVSVYMNAMVSPAGSCP